MSFFTSIFLSNVLVGQNDGLPNITGSIKIAGAGQTRDSEGAFSSSYGMSVNEGFEPGWMFAQQGVGTLSYTFNASKGENKTDGTKKTSNEHKIFGSSNFVTPKNIPIKLWKRIS